MPTMRARACGLRTKQACSMPGRTMSSTNVPAPVSSRASSTRCTRLPGVPGRTDVARCVPSASAHPTTSGSRSQPRTDEVCCSFAASQSTSQDGQRFRISSSATRPSSRASAEPRQ